MSQRLLIILLNTDPRNPEELGAPFYHAAVAAAMDYQVDVVCTATAGRLMVNGVADSIRIKWVGSARAGFDGTVVAHNERLDREPELINSDSYGEGWMLVVRPAGDDWQLGLVTGEAIKPAFEAWLDTGVYKERGD